FLFFYYGDVDHRDIHSFPTRRSSDLIKDNPDVDLIYIVLPNGMHAEYTVRGLQAGKHVLCEKPMANTPAECQQMVDAGRKADRKDRKSTRLNSSHSQISYAVFCLKKK